MYSNRSPDFKQKSVRSQSARATSAGRQRPISGKSINLFVNPDTIENIYTSKNLSPPKKNTPSKILLGKGISSTQLIRYKKTTMYKAPKSQEELYQQNLQLKKQINNLKNSLAITKGREASSKKSILNKEKLDRQFEKQMYWSNTNKSHLITGIKHQYQKLKNEHAQKLNELNKTKSALMSSQIPEYKIYIKELQDQNQRLSERLEQFISEKTSPNFMQASGIEEQVKTEQVENPFAIKIAQNQLKKLTNKLQQLDIRLRAANEGLNEKDKKIEFLEKLIIQKDNREYHAHKKVRKMERNNEQVNNQMKELKETHRKSEDEWKFLYNTQESENKAKIREIQQKNARQIEERDKKIVSLELNNRHLQSMINKLKVSQNALGKSNYGQERKKSFQQQQTLISNKIVRNPDMNNHKQNHEKGEVRLQKTQQISEKEEENKQVIKRMPKRADKRHTEQAKKVRKIRVQEVSQIGQLLKFRIIDAKVDPTKLKQFFERKIIRFNQNESKDSHKNDEQQKQDNSQTRKPSFLMDEIEEKQGEKSEQQLWQQQYITMKELKQILISSPFRLKQEQAYQLARYAIEDCQEEYVYCDQSNENTRDIIKSIIKAVVGEYQIHDEKLKEEEKIFMERYKTNLESALNTYYPQGKMSKKKFQDVLRTMGAQFSQNLLETMIAKMATISDNLQELEYKILFIE